MNADDARITSASFRRRPEWRHGKPTITKERGRVTR